MCDLQPCFPVVTLCDEPLATWQQQTNEKNRLSATTEQFPKLLPGLFGREVFEVVFERQGKNDIETRAWISENGPRHHAAITELAESQASDRTIMSIAGHVSQQMLAHYSHVRIEA